MGEQNNADEELEAAAKSFATAYLDETIFWGAESLGALQAISNARRDEVEQTRQIATRAYIVAAKAERKRYSDLLTEYLAIEKSRANFAQQLEAAQKEIGDLRDQVWKVNHDLEAERADRKLEVDDWKNRIKELCDSAWEYVYPGKTNWEYPAQAIRHLKQYCDELKAKCNAFAEAALKNGEEIVRLEFRLEEATKAERRRVWEEAKALNVYDITLSDLAKILEIPEEER